MRAKAAPSEVAYTENMSVPLDEARKMAIRTGKELSRRARRLLAEEVIRGLSFSHYVVDPAFDMPLTQPIFDFVRFRRGRSYQIPSLMGGLIVSDQIRDGDGRPDCV